jgi:hypothetical protein
VGSGTYDERKTMSTRMKTSTKNLGTFSLSVGEIEIHCCGECGVIFGVSEGLMDIRRNDHRNWYCPNGHIWAFTGENEEERLKRQLSFERDRSARLAATAAQAEASLRTTKGVVTKLKKRVAAGVCPCCNRSFQDLARHMTTQHPDFAA